MNDIPRTIPTLNHETSTSSSSTPRVSLPLPVPTPMGGQVPGTHPPPLARPFETMSPSHGSTATMPRPNSRASPEDNSVTRLPSITPHGMLIELAGEGQPAVLPQIKAEPPMVNARSGNSPPDGAAPLSGWSRQSDQSLLSTDGDPRPGYAGAVSATGIATPAA